jgi:hypothetical protein
MGVLGAFGGELAQADDSADVDLEVMAADPRVAGLSRAVGTRGAYTPTAFAYDYFEKIGAGDSDWFKLNNGKFTLLSSPAAAFVISDLDGNRDRLYHFGGILTSTSSGDVGIGIRPNGLTTNLSSARNTTVEATTMILAEARGNATVVVEGWIWAPTGAPRRIKWTANSLDANPLPYNGVGLWNESVTNLTSLQVYIGAATLGTNSVFWVYSPPTKVRT